MPRAVAFQVRGRLGRRTMVTLGDHSKMWAVLHHTASAKAAYASPPDWAEMQAWRRLLEAGDLFVDVGANAGTYSLWAADVGVEVVAIEPGEDARRLLMENVALNPGAVIHVLSCALGAKAGYMGFTVGLDATNHLLPNANDGHRVEVKTVDEVLGSRRAAGMKIDVEGAERLVLEGAEAALSDRRIQVLQLEWNAACLDVLGEDRSPVAAILERHGFELCRPDMEGRLQPVSDLAFGDDMFAVLRRDPAEGAQ